MRAGNDLLGSLHGAGLQATQQAQQEAGLPDPLSKHLPRIATPSPLLQLPDPKRASLLQPKQAPEHVPHTFHDQTQSTPEQRLTGTMAQAASLLAHTHMLSTQQQPRPESRTTELGQSRTAPAAERQLTASLQPAPGSHGSHSTDAEAVGQSAASSASVGVPTPDQTALSHSEAQQLSLDGQAGDQHTSQPPDSHQDSEDHAVADTESAAHTASVPTSRSEAVVSEADADGQDSAVCSHASTDSITSPAQQTMSAADLMYAAYTEAPLASPTAPLPSYGLDAGANGPVHTVVEAVISPAAPSVQAAVDDQELMGLLSQAQPEEQAPLDLALLSLTQSLSALEQLASGNPFTA